MLLYLRIWPKIKMMILMQESRTVDIFSAYWKENTYNLSKQLFYYNIGSVTKYAMQVFQTIIHCIFRNSPWIQLDLVLLMYPVPPMLKELKDSEFKLRFKFTPSFLISQKLGLQLAMDY